MTALGVAFVVLVACSGIWYLYFRRQKELSELDEILNDPRLKPHMELPDLPARRLEVAQLIPYMGGRADLWKETCIGMALVVVALIPAATLCNWAWNVLASAWVPLFLIACRSKLAPAPAVGDETADS